MPRYIPHKMPAAVKRRYFELIRAGLSGLRRLGVSVSLSCGSLWFIDARRVGFYIETPISPATCPKVMMIDEALATGDAGFRARRQKRINEIRHHAGPCFLSATPSWPSQATCSRGSVDRPRTAAADRPVVCARQFRRMTCDLPIEALSLDPDDSASSAGEVALG
jgi:hypothetical protein